VYRVGAVKESAGRRWLLLDGGMADNARYALYEARYTALPISQPLRPAAGPASLAGPYCESGDILIEDLPCAAIDAGELVAVPVSGAYHLSMASNYNGATRPVVLWLQGGEATLIQAREEAADLLRRDHPLPGHEAALSAVPLRKYQANGNDYLVMRLGARGRMPTPAEIRRICERRGGIGADGLLVDCSQAESGFALRIFNPDGSEAEKSGNGVAIFARYLWDGGRVDLQPFTVSTGGGPVVAQLQPEDGLVTLQLGRATFAQGPEPRAEPLVIDGRPFNCYVVSLGNPHCVVLCDEVTAATAQRWGPLLENAPRFPQRTNVQFVKVVDRTTLQLEIWERGAGYTLASGSSSAAAAAVAHGLNLCDAALVVHTRGGSVEVRVGPERTITVVIPVRKVWQGHLSQEVAPGRDLSGQRRG
jgi:diaminopimelate epimerase